MTLEFSWAELNTLMSGARCEVGVHPSHAFVCSAVFLDSYRVDATSILQMYFVVVFGTAVDLVADKLRAGARADDLTSRANHTASRNKGGLISVAPVAAAWGWFYWLIREEMTGGDSVPLLAESSIQSITGYISFP